MKTRFRFYRRKRGGRLHIYDETTGRQESLHTSNRTAALRLLHARNEAVREPAMNLQIAQVYLQHGDLALRGRTWQHVILVGLLTDSQERTGLHSGLPRQYQGAQHLW